MSFRPSSGSMGGMSVKELRTGEAVDKPHHDLERQCVLELGGRVNSKQGHRMRMYSHWLKACQPPTFPHFSAVPLKMT